MLFDILNHHCRISLNILLLVNTNAVHNITTGFLLYPPLDRYHLLPVSSPNLKKRACTYTFLFLLYTLFSVSFVTLLTLRTFSLFIYYSFPFSYVSFAYFLFSFLELTPRRAHSLTSQPEVRFHHYIHDKNVFHSVLTLKNLYNEKKKYFIVINEYFK